ncbi:hypothetical protein CPC16_006100, partial [Podila verticillata]
AEDDLCEEVNAQGLMYEKEEKVMDLYISGGFDRLAVLQTEVWQNWVEEHREELEEHKRKRGATGSSKVEESA